MAACQSNPAKHYAGSYLTLQIVAHFLVSGSKRKAAVGFLEVAASEFDKPEIRLNIGDYRLFPVARKIGCSLKIAFPGLRQLSSGEMNISDCIQNGGGTVTHGRTCSP
jgi:hypothetical protein